MYAIRSYYGIASRIVAPRSRMISMYSTSTMALFTTMPASMIIPSHTGMDTGSPDTSMPRATPITENGTLSRIMKGLRSDSYWIASYNFV